MQSYMSRVVRWQGLAPQMPAEVSEILNCEEEWWICLGDYRCHSWGEVFREMQQTDVRKVELGRPCQTQDAISTLA